MISDSLRTVMFVSTNLILAVSFTLLHLWQEDTHRLEEEMRHRVRDRAKVAQQLKEAKARIKFLEGQDCEVSLQACIVKEGDRELKLSEFYKVEGNLNVCHQQLSVCLYENIELASECGI